MVGRGDLAAVDVVAGLAEVLRLDLQRARLATVGQAHLAPTGGVVADLADRADRVLHGEVAHHHAVLDHPQHEVARGDLEHRGGLAHVGVADDHVEPAEPLGVGVRLVAGVDDRAAAVTSGDQVNTLGLNPTRHLKDDGCQWLLTVPAS